MIPLRWRIHFSCTKRAAVLDTSSSIPFFFSSLFWFKTISHVVYRLHLFFHKAGKTFVVFSKKKKNSIKSITEEISFRVCGGEWVLFSDWWMETHQCWAGVDWEVGGVRSAVSQSKALWVGPLCFTTLDLHFSHSTTRGQSKPLHIRERGGFQIIFKGQWGQKFTK